MSHSAPKYKHHDALVTPATGYYHEVYFQFYQFFPRAFLDVFNIPIESLNLILPPKYSSITLVPF